MKKILLVAGLACGMFLTPMNWALGLSESEKVTSPLMVTEAACLTASDYQNWLQSKFNQHVTIRTSFIGDEAKKFGEITKFPVPAKLGKIEIYIFNELPTQVVVLLYNEDGCLVNLGGEAAERVDGKDGPNPIAVGLASLDKIRSIENKLRGNGV